MELIGLLKKYGENDEIYSLSKKLHDFKFVSKECENCLNLDTPKCIRSDSNHSKYYHFECAKCNVNLNIYEIPSGVNNQRVFFENYMTCNEIIISSIIE